MRPTLAMVMLFTKLHKRFDVHHPSAMFVEILLKMDLLILAFVDPCLEQDLVAANCGSSSGVLTLVKGCHWPGDFGSMTGKKVLMAALGMCRIKRKLDVRRCDISLFRLAPRWPLSGGYTARSLTR